MKRLVLDGFEVDLNQDIALPITYAISDIKQPNGRKQSVSKQSVLEGTAKNMMYLQSLYSMTLTSENNTFLFDPTIRVTAKLYDELDLVFDGYFKIDEVVIDNGKYSFKFTLFSDVISFYKQLQALYLTDLDFSEYDHALTNTNIRNSLYTSVMVSGVATNNFSGGIPDGFGYLYGLIDNGLPRTSYTTFPAIHIVPQVYFMECFSKMMAKVGVSYNLSLEAEELYRRLVIGGTTGFIPTIDATEINNRKVDVEFLQTETFPAVIKNILSNPPNRMRFYNKFQMNLMRSLDVVNQDILGQYTTGISQFNVLRTGSYELEINISAAYNYTVGSGLNTQTHDGIGGLFYFQVNDVTVSQDYLVFTPTTFTGSYTFPVNLTMGDTVKVYAYILDEKVYDIDPLDFNRNLTMNVTSLDTDIVLRAVSKPILYGDTMKLNTILPKIKCSEIFEALIKLFNCYFEFDSDGVLQITPFIDFYGSTADAEAWSDKVDYSKPITIKPANFIDGKIFNYKFLKDNDYYNDLYFKETGRDYGDKKLEINSQFNQNKVDFMLPFASSVLVQNTGEDLIIPTIIAVDNGVIKPFKAKPRLYIYSGLRTGSYTIEATTYSDYPQLGHFFDVDNPIYDLHWDLPDKVYYNLTTITNSNTFNNYHSKFFNENTHRDSKLMTCSIRLNANDINSLSFSLLKNIDGSLFRLNQVANVDTSLAETFECELIKVIDADSNNTYTGLPAPPPPLDNTTTYRLMTSSSDFSASTTVTNYNSYYFIDTTAGNLNVSLADLIPNSTIVVKNVGTGGNLITLTTYNVDGVASPTLADGVSWTLFYDGNKYYRIQ
jgi:hypothetical protein